MRYLLSSLVQIALLRKDPSVLPASLVLLVLSAAAYGALNILYASIIFGADRIYVRGVADLALALVLFWSLLSLRGQRSRFRQTMSAVTGTYVLISPVITGLFLLRMPAQASPAINTLMLMGSAVLISWYILIVGHILRSAIGIGFVTSIVLVAGWLYGGELLLNRLFAITA
jgi:hypothetical protein